jgi:hypothetical protein
MSETLTKTLVNKPLPGPGKKRLFISVYFRKEDAAANNPALDLFTTYDCKTFCNYVADIARAFLLVGQEMRFDDLRKKCTCSPANHRWWGRNVMATLRSRGIISTNVYVKSSIPSCKGGRTPILRRVS